ncbi:hypothetical protein IW262DRAFT_1448329 [Armillaria fumosa]|nr:hypothetical protein IW262DRAFT_1448329 [Armillaria fumosa]
MLSCSDLYRISSRLSVILNKPDVPFRGMNMIFAGDFAQLPPVMGGESSSLYGSCDGLFASSKRSQEMAMGKAIWHQVNTVSQTPQDEKFRTALVNLRYKAATKEDIDFLQSRVVAKHGGPQLTDPEFHNVSIITDEYNRLGAMRFAEETGQELYSDRIPRGRGARSNIQGISSRLRQTLWAALPSANDKQIPPVLMLCQGMPVMIRTNSATELCITKGQEGTVYVWSSSIGLHGKPVLDIVFVQLINPPSNIHVDDLPPNIIPVVHTSKTVVCTLPDDTTVKVSCTQVEITTNFDMTDFASQVNLNNCRSHQSYYTALSHAATADGTLILPAIGYARMSPIDPNKMQGGCSGHL